MDAKLIGNAGPVAGQEFDLDQPVVTIGRRNENTIAIKDPTVSRKHAEVRREGDALILRDNGSTTGTLVNGTPIAGEHVLRDGDIIGIGGNAAFAVRLRAAEEPTRTFTAEGLRDASPASPPPAPPDIAPATPRPPRAPPRRPPPPRSSASAPTTGPRRRRRAPRRPAWSRRRRPPPAPVRQEPPRVSERPAPPSPVAEPIRSRPQPPPAVAPPPVARGADPDAQQFDPSPGSSAPPSYGPGATRTSEPARPVDAPLAPPYSPSPRRPRRAPAAGWASAWRCCSCSSWCSSSSRWCCAASRWWRAAIQGRSARRRAGAGLPAFGLQPPAQVDAIGGFCYPFV